MKKLIAMMCLAILVGGAAIWLVSRRSSLYDSRGGPLVACTEEAKLCPDGSAVGRSGPNCEFAKCPDSKIESNNVALGQTIILGKVSITPIKIKQDSRCPSDVRCMWQGTVIVQISLNREGGEQLADLTLGQPITFAGTRVSLVGVTPEPKPSQSIESSDYRFTFSVLSAGESPHCIKDADCPSTEYVCEATQGVGTACSGTDPYCQPSYTVIDGICKLRTGSRCSVDADCASGNLCHNNSCASPIGKSCQGRQDTSCPTDFECVEACGPPVVRYPSEEPVSYVCKLKRYDMPCPICLAKGVMIDAPFGEIPIEEIRQGMPVWTVHVDGQKVMGVVEKISRAAAPVGHNIVKLVLSDGRSVNVPPGHPTIDQRTVGDLEPGDHYDGSIVISVVQTPYDEPNTYDLLPSGNTGRYFANGILLDSTLKR